MAMKNLSFAPVAPAVAPRRYCPRVTLPTFALIHRAAEIEELRALMEGRVGEPERFSLAISSPGQRGSARQLAGAPGVDAFFPTQGGSPAEAGAMCARCPVRVVECLEYALEDPSIVGMWGGTSISERNAMRRTGRLGRTA